MKNRRKSTFHRLSIACLTAVLVLVSSVSFAQDEAEKPILTIGCVSDFHNEKSLVQTDNPLNVRLRGSVSKVFTKMGQEEDLDIVLVGGDCSSEAEVTEEVWMAMKERITKTIRLGFKGNKPTPVIYATGNHDYELSMRDETGGRIYNSADYYSYPMKQDIGELSADDYIMETATRNGKSLPVMSAYHYNVYGFDFITLNCGMYSFASSGDYQYSIQSVRWVRQKLAEICKDDPDKTIFFILHIPFGDSNSLRYPGKGISPSTAETLLKQTLAQYPNLIMLYGHDHGGDQAYTRRTTAQRITHYDSNGRVIPTTDATHVSGPTSDPENDFCDEHPKYTLYNEDQNKFVGIADGNLAPVDTKKDIIFTRNTTGQTYTCSIDDNSIHNGSSARSFSEGEASPIMMYEIDEYSEGQITGHRTTELVPGRRYMVVRKQDSDAYYILNCSTVSTGGMTNLRATADDSGDVLTYKGYMALTSVWKLCPPVEEKKFYITSARTGKYLNCNVSNLATVAASSACTVSLIADETPLFRIQTELSGTETSKGRYLFSGTDGYYSCNTSGSNIYLYKVIEQTEDNVVTAVRTRNIVSGEKYVILGQNKKDDSLWYALTNRSYIKSSDSYRLYAIALDPTDTITFTDRASMSAIWQFDDASLEEATPSFFSAFMGSTRHYLNGIDSGMIETGTPNIIQALMIYVYSDRVVLEMKNYNRFGLCDNGITVNEKLATYTSFRKVNVPSGIKNISMEDAFVEDIPTAASGIYDLQGRRIADDASLKKGIYIVNGRKIAIQ